MNGSVLKKKGRFYPVTREKQNDGTYKQRYHGGHATKRAASAALNEIVNRINKGNFVEPSKLRVKEYLVEQWLPAMKSVVRPSTHDSYTRVVQWHVVDSIGELRLQSLTAGHLNALYARLAESGRRDGQGGLSPKSVRYVHGIIRKALGDAATEGLVVQNVATKAKAPRLKAVKSKELPTWTAEQLRSFLDHVKHDRLFAAWRLLASTGMRRGEALGLRWDNVDLEAGRVSVRDTLISVNYEVLQGDAKTQKGVRVIDLDDTTVASLKSHRRRQAEEKLAWGPAYQALGLVFTREDGSPIHPDGFSQAFRKHVARASLPSIRLHDLRHTHATLALKAGVPVKVISERLGHADVAFTMNTYAHAIPGMQAEAAALVAALVDG